MAYRIGQRIAVAALVVWLFVLPPIGLISFLMWVF
jgi:hypothetical protein